MPDSLNIITSGFSKKKKVKLYRNFENIYTTIPYKKQPDINFSKIRGDFAKELLKFCLAFEKNSLIDTNILRKNIQSLQISLISEEDSTEDKCDAGYYSMLDNKIVIIKNETEILYNGLLRMASTVVVSPSLVFSGFSQTSKTNGTIGTALTDGFTALIDQKYFSKELYRRYYKFEKYMASVISQIVGEEKCEQLYFKADLNSLINELSKYADRQKIIKMILLSDYISNKDYLTDEDRQVVVDFSSILAEIITKKIAMENPNFSDSKKENLFKRYNFQFYGFIMGTKLVQDTKKYKA